MFDVKYRPMSRLFGIHTDYQRIPYKFRQKIKVIQHEMISLSYASHDTFKMYLFDTGFMLYDKYKNRIIWTENYMYNSVALIDRLRRLTIMFDYEQKGIKNMSEIECRDYSTLRKLFNYE